jgi:hypothetical protein
LELKNELSEIKTLLVQLLKNESWRNYFRKSKQKFWICKNLKRNWCV